MPKKEMQPAGGQSEQDVKRLRYAEAVSQVVRQPPGGRFSVFPTGVVKRMAEGWYNAFLEVTLQGNHFAVEEWVHKEAALLATQDLAFPDLVLLLQTCRRLALEQLAWNEEQINAVDDLLNEALMGLSAKVAWTLPEKVDYRGVDLSSIALPARSPASREPTSPEAIEKKGEKLSKIRRRHQRVDLEVPILVCTSGADSGEEVTQTINVSRGGVYFPARRMYAAGMKVRILYPYSEAPGIKSPEYPAEVVRVDKEASGRKKVAIRFLTELAPEDE